MSSRRRRHSGPPRQPRQHFRGASYPDENYWHPSDYPPRASGASADRLPPSYPRGETWPAERPELDRGRSRERGHRGPHAAGSQEGNDSYEARDAQYRHDESRSRRRRRPRSHDRISDRDSHRGRPSPSRHAGSPRPRSSAPRSKSTAPSVSRSRRIQSTASQLWQNPIVRTCAITAVSTGLSAALDSRGDPGQWKGAKGAKVAVASLGSALVDGFLGQKHPNSVRQQVVRKGFQVAMEETEKKKQQPMEGRDDDARRPREPREPREPRGRDHEAHEHGRRRRHSEGSRSHRRHH